MQKKKQKKISQISMPWHQTFINNASVAQEVSPLQVVLCNVIPVVKYHMFTKCNGLFPFLDCKLQPTLLVSFCKHLLLIKTLWSQPSEIMLNEICEQVFLINSSGMWGNRKWYVDTLAISRLHQRVFFFLVWNMFGRKICK